MRNMTHLESMYDFFTSRVEGYDEHMIQNVEDCKDGYIQMARLVRGKSDKNA